MSPSSEDNFKSILSGKLSGAELVIGLVAPTGTNLECIERDITECLEKYGYSARHIRVSNLIKSIAEIPTHYPITESGRINAYMDAGDTARESTGENAILALSAVRDIYATRETDEYEKVQPSPRQAYIINSLKHPDEVNALRRIYGNAFFLMGVYVDPGKRKNRLTREKGMSEEEAEAIIQRDEEEGPKHGQRTRDTFHLSDFFVHLLVGNDDEERKTKATIERFLDIVFADPYRTPLFDEYAMFMAFAAATRSADLSRQVGALIAKDEEILASGVNDCPRAGGGTYWPVKEDSGVVHDIVGGRDHTHGVDRNDAEKESIVNDAITDMKMAWQKENEDVISTENWEILKRALELSKINDITEYGRVVHAEMDALLTCARNNISSRGATLFATTFPCHNCAKHIIAAGIERVVYVEPYPKSKALDFHKDSVEDGFEKNLTEEGKDNGEYAENVSKKVSFHPFVGVGPRRFFDLFSMKQGSGFPLIRKNKENGNVLQWDAKSGTIRIPQLPWSYLEREEFASEIVGRHSKRNGEGGSND